MILLLSMLCSGLAAENLEKTQKKELEAQVKTMTAEAQSLERSGRLAEARIKYAESQALIEMKDVTDALKHLDEEIQKRVKSALNDSRKLYETHKFREAALALDEAMKLQAFQPVLAYNLALCYHQLGERDKALEYLGKARSGTADPKQKQKLMQMVSFFTTGESGLSLNESRQRSGDSSEPPGRQHRPGGIIARRCGGRRSRRRSGTRRPRRAAFASGEPGASPR